MSNVNVSRYLCSVFFIFPTYLTLPYLFVRDYMTPPFSFILAPGGWDGAVNVNSFLPTPLCLPVCPSAPLASDHHNRN